MTQKIQSLLGKKFALHDINFILPSHKLKIVENDGIDCEITRILDYVDKFYYEVKVGEEKLLIATQEASHKVGDKIKVDIDVNDIGIYDVNFGVRIA